MNESVALIFKSLFLLVIVQSLSLSPCLIYCESAAFRQPPSTDWQFPSSSFYLLQLLLRMEAVGARLGRSSTRYGPATVFSGPVRKWKKRWVPLSSSSPSSNPSAHSSSNNNNNASHLLLYKWTPLSHSSNNNSNAAKDDASAAPDEPPRRKFRYVPVCPRSTYHPLSLSLSLPF